MTGTHQDHVEGLAFQRLQRLPPVRRHDDLVAARVE
jgi:hypothetical protein